MSKPMTNRMNQIVSDLDRTQPANLTAAREKLGELIAATRGSVEELLAETQPNYSLISERVAAIEVLVASLAELDKAEAAANATFERVWRRLRGDRNEQRVWNKLRTSGETVQ